MLHPTSPKKQELEESDEISEEILFGDAVDNTDAVNISHTQISVNFQISELEVVFGAEIRGTDREFANLRLQEFILAYSNVSKPFTEVSINLGGLHVEDLLHEGDPAYRFLMKSSDNKTRLDNENLSFTSRLSTSCPEGTSYLNYTDLSSSLPSILTYSPKHHTPQMMTQLRPMMLSQRKFPSQPQLSWTKESLSEDESEVEHLLSKANEDSWVKVKITLIDDDFQSEEHGETFVSGFIFTCQKFFSNHPFSEHCLRHALLFLVAGLVAPFVCIKDNGCGILTDEVFEYSYFIMKY